MKALILDLRWNPGGLLDEAVDVCQKFLPRGQLSSPPKAAIPRKIPSAAPMAAAMN